jgi:hypothetical protein
MAEFGPGTRLCSVACNTEVVITMGSISTGALTCAGAAMIPAEDAGRRSVAQGDPAADRTLLGKRYRARGELVEVLCTRQGRGALALYGEPLQLGKPKTLPASD